MSQVTPLEPYIGLVEYLGAALGAQYEILLQDMEHHILLTIANGYISARIKGGSVTPLALELEQQGIWRNTDYLTNIHCVALSGHNVLSSFCFIKEDARLLGILSINLDLTLFSQSNSPDLSVFSNIIGGAPAKKAALPTRESAPAPGGMAQIVNDTIAEYLRQHGTSVERLTHQERQALISILKERDVFRVRGSVRHVAQKIQCSGATIYRYLQK